MRLPKLPVLLLVLLTAGDTLHAIAADDKEPDSSLEIIRYKAPPGWKSSDLAGGGARTYISPDSTNAQQALILLTLGPAKEGLDLRASFDVIAKQMMQGGKITESTELTPFKTRQGFEGFHQTLTAEQGDGHKVIGRILCANVQNRLAAFCYLASSTDFYNQHLGAFDNLLDSVKFDAGNSGSKTAAAAAAATAEIQALEAQKQELLKKVAEIEARQRQLAGAQAAAAAAGPGVKGGLEAIWDENDRLMKAAREKSAREADGRRKPHTVLGDILGADGKPIPNVDFYKVYVYGTTIAAEKTSYGIDVDANGHFEQKVPDGLYRVTAACIVKYGDHRIPVDLTPLDGRTLSVTQDSSLGIVKDFRLDLDGLRPGEDPKGDRSWNGGLVNVNGPTYDLYKGSLSTRHPNTKLQLTFAPKGPLVDGTKRQPFVIETDIAQVTYSFRLRRIPLTAYQVSASLVSPDGSKLPLAIASDFNGPYGASADITWECHRDNQEQRDDPQIYLKD
jgi:hypothetical protein